MTINNEKKLRTRGIVMLAIFLILLGILFSPVFPGKKIGLDYIDNLFNTISKGSSDFIAQQFEESKVFSESTLELEFPMKSAAQAEEFAQQLALGGLTAKTADKTVTMSGKMTEMVAASLRDCREMFDNKGDVMQNKYGFSGKEALFNWWTAYHAMVDKLNGKKKFKEAKFLNTLRKKALEPAYNYYGIEAQPWKANVTMIVVALAFYVFYTVWYGFGILYLFEGLGLKVGH